MWGLSSDGYGIASDRGLSTEPWRQAENAVFALAAASFLTLSFALQPAQAQSARSWQSEGDHVRHVVVTLFKSKTFHLDKAFSTAVVGAPDIVDALPMSDRTLYIQGKKVGTTNVTVFDQ